MTTRRRRCIDRRLGGLVPGMLAATVACAAVGCGPRGSVEGGGSGTGTTTSTPDVPPVAECGNGVVEAPEACDDGNREDGDGCQGDCTFPPYHGQRIYGAGLCKCVWLPEGRLRCWGMTSACGYGEYDVGWEETPAEAGDVPSPGPVDDLALTLHTSCAIMSDRRLRCWGDDQNSPARGLLGQGEPVSGARSLAESVEVKLPPGAVRSAGLSDFHACAAMETGELYCWGYNGSGQLGYGTGEAVMGDDETPWELGPVDVGGEVLQVALGLFHTCVLLADGGVRCFGAQREDPLGCGWTIPSEECPATGVLGTGVPENVGDDEVPSSVPPVDIGGPAVEVGASAWGSCALRSDGKLYCWGSSSVAFGPQVVVGDDETPAQWGPVAEGVDDWTRTENHAWLCVHRVGGGWWCAGGMLSVFGWAESDWSKRVELDGLFGEEVLGVAPSYYYGVDCVLLASGTVKCWGRTLEGARAQFGYGMQPVYECNTDVCPPDGQDDYCCVGASTPPWELPPVPYE